ncbi:hypothetical protein HDR67_00560, partial [bacterium]|nr:hypothetical protein [bacterium]
MKLQLRQRKQPNLKKLIKTDVLGTPVSEEPLYVLLDEAEGNIEAEGTAITPEVVDKINWRDDAYLEFAVLEGNDLPSKKEGIVQLVAKQNGELWCIPPTQNAYALGTIDTSSFMSKSGKVYVNGKSLEYFNINKEAKIFSTRTRIGAIPVRLENTAEFQEDGTYIEFDKSGYSKLFIQGQPVFVFTNERMEATSQGSVINIDRTGDIHLRATKNADVGLSGQVISILSSKLSIQSDDINLKGKISISNENIKIQETKEGDKFNCFTTLDNASFGNKNLRLQFYPDFLRLQDVSNPDAHKKILEVQMDGTILICDKKIPTTHPLGFTSRSDSADWGEIKNKGKCVTSWGSANGGAIQFREADNKLYAGINGLFYQNGGRYKVIDENSIDSYIEAYFDKHFETYYGLYQNLLFTGCQQEVYQNVEQTNLIYRVDFSEEPKSKILSITFKG